MATTENTMYLQRRNGVYYFRRRIPARAIPFATDEEKSSFHHSLETRDRKKAIEALPGRIEQTNHILRQIEERSCVSEAPEQDSENGSFKRERFPVQRRTKTFYQLSESQIDALVRNWFSDALNRHRQQYSDDRIHFSEGAREAGKLELTEIISELRHRPDAENAGRWIHSEILSLLEKADCSAPLEWTKYPPFRRFYNRIAQGLIHLHEVALEILEKGYEQKAALPLKGDIPAYWQPAQHSMTPADRSGITLNELIERFSTDAKRQILRPGTNKEYNLVYRALRETFDEHRQVASISREEIRELAEMIRALPAYATTKFPKLTLKEIALRAKADSLSPAHVKSYNKKIHSVGAIFRFAENEGFIVQNPARNLALPVKKQSGIGKSHSLDALQKIFSGRVLTQFVEANEAQFTPNHKLRPCLFWAPLIALFSGMRSNEILQLGATSDILCMDGVDTFRPSGEVKNQPSYRTVPVHPELKKLGLMRYVENVRRKGHEKLFPDARISSDGRFSTWFQKPFARYLKEIGVKSGRKECFHSFRHNFIEGLRRADVPQDVRVALTGHTRGDSEEAFYGGEALKRNERYLGQLIYEGLDLSHLYPQHM